MKPTPGPWRVYIRGDYLQVRADSQPYGMNCWTKEDAHLIAAAGTAAHQAEQAGYDGVAAIEALYDILENLDNVLLNYPLIFFPFCEAGSPEETTKERCERAKKEAQILLTKLRKREAPQAGGGG